MKNQALFSSKDKSKKLKCCLLQFLFGTLRVKSFSSLHLKEFCIAAPYPVWESWVQYSVRSYWNDVFFQLLTEALK